MNNVARRAALRGKTLISEVLPQCMIRAIARNCPLI